MRKWINFWLAIAMSVNGIGLVLTGMILRWAVPGGPGRGVGDGTFLFRERHDWRDLHFHLALLFVVLIVTHIVLHWDWITARLRELEKAGKST